MKRTVSLSVPLSPQRVMNPFTRSTLPVPPPTACHRVESEGRPDGKKSSCLAIASSQFGVDLGGACMLTDYSAERLPTCHAQPSDRRCKPPLFLIVGGPRLKFGASPEARSYSIMLGRSLSSLQSFPS